MGCVSGFTFAVMPQFVSRSDGISIVLTMPLYFRSLSEQRVVVGEHNIPKLLESDGFPLPASMYRQRCQRNDDGKHSHYFRYAHGEAVRVTSRFAELSSHEDQLSAESLMSLIAQTSVETLLRHDSTQPVTATDLDHGNLPNIKFRRQPPANVVVVDSLPDAWLRQKVLRAAIKNDVS